MEKSFDLGALLKKHEKKHKCKPKPTQFASLASGVKKRLENNLKHRRSSRLTIFDKIRNLEKCESPVKLSVTQRKVEHRRQQLEKWKEEKEKKKKEAAAQKKKPFLTGAAHATLKFEPPPPIKPVPGTSGPVTRSQAAKVAKQKIVKDLKSNTTSFAPKNASFQPPQNLVVIPKILPVKSAKDKKGNIVMTFEPILTNVKSKVTGDTKETRFKSTKQQTEFKVTRTKQIETKSSKAKIVKKERPLKEQIQSSSKSQIELLDQPLTTNKRNIRKSHPPTASPVLKNKTPRKSPGIPAKGFTPKNPVPKSESSSEEKLRSPKTPSPLPMSPEQIAEWSKISPCVTMSRGKDNARREMKKKMEEGYLDDDVSDMESVDHFRRQLATEINRMTEMCDMWDKISEQTQLPEAVQEAVLSAVGQARLLMSQKLVQFGVLVERCAQPDPGSALVTPADLHGFWDMVFMQVENVDMRFKKLGELRDRGWVEEQPAEVTRKVVKPVVKKAVKSAAGPSRLREMIAAARKAKKEQETHSPAPAPTDDGRKTFEAGFFCVRSPVRSPANPSTPNSKSSLLKTVLSSEAKKASASKNSASFAMLRASVMAKNVEYDGIALLPQSPLAQINLQATPSRSILKSAKPAEEPGKKSIKVVLFDQSDTELQETSDGHCTSLQLTEEKQEKVAVTHPEADLTADSGISSMDVEKDSEKENSRRKSKITRQSAVEEISPMLTRSMRRSMRLTPAVEADDTSKRSGRRKKVLHQFENNVI